MKNPKFIVLVFTFLCYTLIVNAQAVVTKIMDRQVRYNNECIGEIISGVENWTFVYRYDKDGNAKGLHMSAAGGTLVGETTGNEYKYKYLFLDNYKAPWPEDTEQYNGAYKETFILVRQIVSLGNRNVNLFEKMLYRLTITPDGEIILDELDRISTCR